MVSVRGSGRIDGQVRSVSGAGRVRLRGHVKRSTLNSADYLEFPDRTVGPGSVGNKLRLTRVRLRKSVHSIGSDLI